MCSHWTLPVGDESFHHPLIMFLDDPVVGEGSDNLKQEPWLHTKMAFTYFTVPKMVGGRSGCAYFGTYFLYKFVWVSVVRCTYTIRCGKHEATVPLQTELESLIVVLPCILISTKLIYQQMHLLLKHKMLQFIFKISFLIWLLHVSVTSDHHQGAYDGTLPELVSLKSLVKTHC